MARHTLPARTASSLRGAVSIRVTDSGPDTLTVEMGVDYSRAEVPDRSYYADYCDVQKARFGFSLIFGKLIAGSARLRTRIEVAFPTEMFTVQLWNNSRGFHDTVRNVAANSVAPGEELREVGTVEDTDKVQTFRSNNVFMGVWGQDAVADFYYISPRDIHMLRTKQNPDVNLEPVVRVAMETLLMLEFLEKCRPWIDKSKAVDAPIRSR